MQRPFCGQVSCEGSKAFVVLLVVAAVFVDRFHGRVEARSGAI